MPEQGGFFLRARNRYPEVFFSPDAQRGDVELTQQRFDVRLVDRMTGEIVSGLRLFAVRQI